MDFSKLRGQIGTNFFHPGGEWTAAEKRAYRIWLLQMSPDHPCHKTPDPWDERGWKEWENGKR